MAIRLAVSRKPAARQHSANLRTAKEGHMNEEFRFWFWAACGLAAGLKVILVADWWSRKCQIHRK